jgi:bifunctional DNA-binding transcriptional regulator/antitoxin component of YhaV-PrlF toxin-antitoxin module
MHRQILTSHQAATDALPQEIDLWYTGDMSGSHATVMGDRGRLVVPAELRARAGLVAGTPVTLIEAADGIVLLTREQLKRMVRRDLAGTDLVSDLMADRRRAAALEDAGGS